MRKQQKRNSMPFIYRIYTLTDPRNGNIFYVGCTCERTLRHRLVGHLRDSKLRRTKTNQYIFEIVKAGFEPVIEEVDRMTRNQYCEYRGVENYWILQFKAWGFDLTNEKMHYRRNKYKKYWWEKAA